MSAYNDYQSVMQWLMMNGHGDLGMELQRRGSQSLQYLYGVQGRCSQVGGLFNVRPTGPVEPQTTNNLPETGFGPNERR